MNKYEDKYGIKENKQVIEFHKSRRMFCIKEGKLMVAESGLDCSHAVWFEREGWMDETDDSFMNTNVRGIVDKGGEVYFYRGYDFFIDEEGKKEFFKHIKELAEILKLKLSSKIYGGKNSKEGKYYGVVRDFVTTLKIN